MWIPAEIQVGLDPVSLHRHTLVVPKCDQYSLPDPLQTPVAPETKLKFKSQVKMSICRYWRSSLIKQSETLRTLCYMKLAFLPWVKEHTLCGRLVDPLHLQSELLLFRPK